MEFGALSPCAGLLKSGRPHAIPAQATPGLLDPEVGPVDEGSILTVLLLAAIKTVWGGGEANF